MINKIIVASTAGMWQIPMILKAKELGCIIVAIDADPLAPGLQLADHVINTELTDIETIYAELQIITGQISGALSYCSDAGMRLAELIMRHYNHDEAMILDSKLFTNKGAQRNRWKDAGLPIPKFELFKDRTAALKYCINKQFPLVIKPTDSAGSRGVGILKDRQDRDRLINNAFYFSNENQIIVEDYFEGTEYTVEIFAQGGRIYPLLITQKVKIEETGGTVSSELWTIPEGNEIYKVLADLASDGYMALNLKNGVGHMEIIRNPVTGEMIIVEAAARGGGFNLASQLIPACTGIDFAKLSLSLYLDFESEFKPKYYRPSVLFFVPSEKGTFKNIQGVEVCNEIPGVFVEVLAKVGQRFSSPNSDADRICSVVISASDESKLREKVEKVKSMLMIHFNGE